MNAVQKTKGKRPKKARNGSTLGVETSQTSPEQKVVNKKRKYDSVDEGLNVPVQKKSKRKRDEEECIGGNTITAASVSPPRIKNNKRTTKKSLIKNTEINDTHTNVENEENIKQQINVPINIPTKCKKKAKTNSGVLKFPSMSEVKNEVNLAFNEIVSTTKDSVPKKSKKKMKTEPISSVSHNGDICNNIELKNKPKDIQKLNHNETLILNEIAINDYTSLNCSIDIKENILEIKPEVEHVPCSNIDTNERDITREVNVIAIKNEGLEENNENVVTISIQDIEGANTNEAEEELLKQLEQKIKPVSSKQTINWPQEDLKELLSRLEKTLPENDVKPFSKRLEITDWSDVVFKNYTVEQCQAMWSKIQKKIRKYRVLAEIVQDAKTWIDSYSETVKKKGRPQKHPDMPRKPLTAYFLYYLENRDKYLMQHPGVDASEIAKALAQTFQSLTPEERKKYENKSLERKKEYNKRLEEFYMAHPEIPRMTKDSKSKAEKSAKPPKPVKEKPPPKPPKPVKEKIPVRPHIPFHYFYVSEMEKEEVEDKTKFKEICKERWKHLPERTKLVWIHYAEAEMSKYETEMEEYKKKHPEHVTIPLKPILSKEDMQIKDRAAGKPPKPPGSAYNLFASKLLQSEEIKNVPFRDRLVFVSNQWKYCSDNEKKYYKELYHEAKNKHQEDYRAYLSALPEEERKEELKKNAPKMFKFATSEEKKKKEVKKKKKVQKKTETVTEAITEPVEKLKEPQQPPISPFKYFSTVFTGEDSAKAWKVLSKEEKKHYEEQLIQLKKDYIRDFERFLKSLSEEELEEFSKSRRRAKEEKQDDLESDSDDSEDSSGEEDNDEEEDDG